MRGCRMWVNASKVVVAQRPRLESGILSLSGDREWLVLWIAGAGQRRSVILYGADMTRVVWPVFDGSLEHDPLVVALALALRLNTVVAGRSLFATFDPAFSTSKAPGLGTFPHFVGRGSSGDAGGGRITSTPC